MPRAQRVALGIQVFVVVAASLYWALWYGGGRALIANQARVRQDEQEVTHRVTREVNEAGVAARF